MKPVYSPSKRTTIRFRETDWGFSFGNTVVRVESEIGNEVLEEDYRSVESFPGVLVETRHDVVEFQEVDYSKIFGEQVALIARAFIGRRFVPRKVSEKVEMVPKQKKLRSMQFTFHLNPPKRKKEVRKN